MTWVEVAIPSGSFLLSVLAWFASTRARNQTHRLEHVKVNADAYDKAQVIYDKAIASLNRQNEQLEQQLSRCESRIDQLTEALDEAGIRIPPEAHRERTARELRTE